METTKLSTKVELHLRAIELVNKDLLSKSDPFAVVYVKDSKGSWIERCRTATVWNNVNPEWSDQILLDYFFEMVQDLMIEVYDRDAESEDLSKHDLIGSFTTTLSKLMGSIGTTVSGPLLHPKRSEPQGKLIISGQEVAKTGGDFISFQAKAVKLDRKNLMGLGRSDPFFVINQIGADGTFIRVFESEVKMKNLNPTWKEHSVSMQRICNGDAVKQLKIDVFDFESSGNHQLIGSFETTVEEMTKKSSFTLVHPKGKKASSGTFELISFKIGPAPSFLDYIRGGCVLNLIVAVDFTGSNGNPRDASSLHHITPGQQAERDMAKLNQYQRAMWGTGSILEDYDTDKMIGLFGFGANVNGGTSHCFPMGRKGEEEVRGVDGVMDAYEQFLQTVELSGPTRFGSIIKKALSMAKPSKKEQKYTVLLILTDGIIDDMYETIKLIVEGSSLPLSIVIVGVGRANFSDMQRLDGDEVTLSYNGKAAERDIVQFVPFEATFAEGPAALSEEVLREIPEQLVSYFRANGIAPKPPRIASESHFKPIKE